MRKFVSAVVALAATCILTLAPMVGPANAAASAACADDGASASGSTTPGGGCERSTY